MAGVMDALMDPKTMALLQMGAGLLQPTPFKGAAGFGMAMQRGLGGAMDVMANAERQKYMQAQMQNLQSEAALRNAQIDKAKADQARLQAFLKLRQGGGTGQPPIEPPGAVPGAAAPLPTAPIGPNPLDPGAAVHAFQLTRPDPIAAINQQPMDKGNPGRKNVTAGLVDSWLAEAKLAEDLGLFDIAKERYERVEKWRKVKSTEPAMLGGKPVTKIIYEIGGIGYDDSSDLPPDVDKIDRGDAWEIRDKRTGKVLETVKKEMSPSETDTSKRGWDSNRRGWAELNLRKTERIVGQGQDGFVVIPKFGGVADGGVSPSGFPSGTPAATNDTGSPAPAAAPSAPRAAGSGAVVAAPIVDAAGNPIKGAGAKPTEAEGVAASYLTMMRNSLEAWNSIPESARVPFGGVRGTAADTIRSIPFAGSSKIGENIATSIDTGDRNRAMTVSKVFTEQYLRALTGAAAPEPEVARVSAMLFPQPGESKETQELKAQMREAAMQGVDIRAGRLSPQVKNAPLVVKPRGDNPIPLPKPAKELTAKDMVKGQVYMTPKGKARWTGMQFDPVE